MNKNNVNKIQISLIELSLENFKTIKEKATFSMSTRKSSHTFESQGENLLKSSFIFGPNASGKTTILEAVAVIKNLINFSANIKNISLDQNMGTLPYNPFKGSISTQNKPTVFEIVFSLKNKHDGIYKYMFSYDSGKILSEELSYISGTEKMLFSRDISTGIQIISDIFQDQKNLVANVREDALFLSSSAVFNNIFARDIIVAFNDIWLISGMGALPINVVIDKIKSDENYKNKILNYLQIADFTITGTKTKEVDMQGIEFKFDGGQSTVTQSANKKENMLVLEHPIFDDNKNKTNTAFELDFSSESLGTQKFIAYIGFIVEAIEGGKVLLVDELDCSLHPILTKFIIDLFESEEVNKNNAQLIATTHDTSLLSYKEDYIKDQFWFTEKDVTGASKLFSLSDFDDLRNDTEYSKKYLEGRFGALPFVESIKK